VSTEPTVFHLTHPKAGSQWIGAVLEACAPERIVKAKVRAAQFYQEPVRPGMIYAALYVPKSRFDETIASQTSLNQNQVIKLVVIRDLRDALISLYFSLKVSHPLLSENVAEGRKKLNELDFEDGLMYLIEERSEALASIQSSWLPACHAGEALLVRYEELLADEQRQFASIIAHCEIKIPAERLSEIVHYNSFTIRAGREPGKEDMASHFRKGIAGDWGNHFTDRLKSEFKKRHGQVLIDTGYERDMEW